MARCFTTSFTITGCKVYETAIFDEGEAWRTKDESQVLPGDWTHNVSPFINVGSFY